MKNKEEKNKILGKYVYPGRRIGWRIYGNTVLILLLPFRPNPETKVLKLRGSFRTYIWKLIKDRLQVREIVNLVARKKRVEPKVVEKGIIAFVKKLAAERIVDILDTPD